LNSQSNSRNIFKIHSVLEESMRNVTAIVDREKCHPNECQHECMSYDPLNRSGGEGFHLGPHGKSEISEEVVTEMHKICAKMCPFDAIRIVRLPTELKQEPIHRFGENLFRLYNIPVPVFGKVVGILGVNGIGKSTAIKILAGLLQPNFGKENSASYDELIEFFKGTEAQAYFEKVKAGDITISYKPQQVDLIPKTTQGTVKELLQKVDERNAFDEVVAALDLSQILDRDIAHISGGELQRVAIAATVLKKANLYLFDEPTSYLDIKQRINVSQFIQSLATPDTGVLVIEHDLIILDHMTEVIHIMFGQEAAYGIVSMPKTTRQGINTYLEGYMKESNMRFRDRPITFEVLQPPKIKDAQILVSWKNMKKNFGDFLLEAEEGELRKGEVTGVLGPNGIGKTSFVKILAEVIKQDSGEISSSVKVSYKPQYIDTTSEELVMHVLEDAVQNYEVALIRPLKLKELLLKKVSELSGGELQRVAIARCLSQEAELYLLDEPSAYLDAEQRLIVSRVIKNVIEQKGAAAFVVDHDLLFIDYLSHNLIVFEGEPAKHGRAFGPFSMQEGMNRFLKELDMTFRRDPESHRPRANKPGSQIDQQQKKENKLYYV